MHLLSAFELRKRFENGELKAREIAEHFLARIDKHSKNLGSFLHVLDERALKKADELDLRKSKGEKLGLLAGIPIAIKDNMHIKGEITTCGSKFLTNYRAPFDASVCKFLEDQDAILIGKTNLDEFAMGSSNENSAFFPAKNPWNTECVPGGSSGGSAAAVSARLAPLATGSDTGGSIRQPASFCGIVGYKPTYGRVSRYGLVAFGSSLDQIGPFATCVEDIALIMEAIARPCAHDSTSISHPPESFLENLPTDLKGKRIGVPWKFLEEMDAKALEAFKANIEQLKALGAEIVDVDLSILKYSIAIYYILATAEASTNLARFDGIRYGVRSPNAKALEDIYDFSRDEGFGKEVKKRILLGTHVLSSGYKDAYYKKAQKVRTLIIERYNSIFKECDLISMPVSPFAAFKFGAITDPIQMYLQDIFTVSANLAGLPAISVPAGFDHNKMPVGLQFLAPQMKDKTVIDAAHAFEKSAKIPTMPEAFA